MLTSSNICRVPIHYKSGYVFLKKLYHIADYLYIFYCLVWNFDVKFVLQIHHKIDDIQRIGAKVFNY